VDGVLDWYLLGVALGLGVAAGVGRFGALAERVLAALSIAAAVAAGYVATTWGVAAAFLGLALALAFFRNLAREAVLAAFLALAALAFVPVLGYLEALAAPLVGRRLSRRAGDRYAGLRVLAKD
jgi:hypothetical protein